MLIHDIAVGPVEGVFSTWMNQDHLPCFSGILKGDTCSTDWSVPGIWWTEAPASSSQPRQQTPEWGRLDQPQRPLSPDRRTGSPHIHSNQDGPVRTFSRIHSWAEPGPLTPSVFLRIIIDVSAADSVMMEQHEYMDKARQYRYSPPQSELSHSWHVVVHVRQLWFCFSTKLAVLSNSLPHKKAPSLPSLTSQPHQVLASDLVSYLDVQQVQAHLGCKSLKLTFASAVSLSFSPGVQDSSLCLQCNLSNQSGCQGRAGGSVRHPLILLRDLHVSHILLSVSLLTWLKYGPHAQTQHQGLHTQRCCSLLLCIYWFTGLW